MHDLFLMSSQGYIGKHSGQMFSFTPQKAINQKFAGYKWYFMK